LWSRRRSSTALWRHQSQCQRDLALAVREDFSMVHSRDVFFLRLSIILLDCQAVVPEVPVLLHRARPRDHSFGGQFTEIYSLGFLPRGRRGFPWDFRAPPPEYFSHTPPRTSDKGCFSQLQVSSVRRAARPVRVLLSHTVASSLRSCCPDLFRDVVDDRLHPTGVWLCGCTRVPQPPGATPMLRCAGG